MSFARPSREAIAAQRAAEKQRNLQALAHPLHKPRAATYANAGEFRPLVKSEAKRCPALLDMARSRPCLLMIPGLCNHRIDTTVAAHSNLSIHGKAGARKADDCYSVWGCANCHLWLDTSKALAAVKEAAFMTAHARQVLAWRLVATDPSEPERFRRAARWAIEQLNATPIGEAL
jgi:hypothetical protein